MCVYTLAALTVGGGSNNTLSVGTAVNRAPTPQAGKLSQLGQNTFLFLLFCTL